MDSSRNENITYCRVDLFLLLLPSVISSHPGDLSDDEDVLFMDREGKPGSIADCRRRGRSLDKVAPVKTLGFIYPIHLRAIFHRERPLRLPGQGIYSLTVFMITLKGSPWRMDGLHGTRFLFNKLVPRRRLGGKEDEMR